jgi:hypothetical protein
MRARPEDFVDMADEIDATADGNGSLWVWDQAHIDSPQAADVIVRVR